MIVVTTEHVSGQQETASLGLVRGSSIRARHVGKDIMAVFRNLVGGEVRVPG
ncbi:MAG TPA: heavy metal-binding domain-containing protein, partial [Gemmatimonadetes bacterium]|nr:heavy metal-binding domain-containing protein [Gemmatimonadota bacterium]